MLATGGVWVALSSVLVSVTMWIFLPKRRALALVADVVSELVMLSRRLRLCSSVVSCRLAPIGFSTHCFTVLLNRATGSLYVIKDLTFLRFSRRAIGEEFGGSLWSEELPLLGGSVGVVTHPSAAADIPFPSSCIRPCDDYKSVTYRELATLETTGIFPASEATRRTSPNHGHR
ncbi:hypothetical protein F2Q68_00013028 [Brassica cretica]|uniref:Uncharacterized protein n=1 Tax=Brassica cretica TaxID=69181 RepID=A0A8S9HJC3_BRACR|nr:hypothetical protein F2Q68_00013028 [Brassica cretica]